MYHIIGADGQPRGPIDAATLTRWITEGRADGQTQTCPDGGSEWKSLAYLPEFAAALSQAPPNISAHASQSDATGGLIPYKNKQALIGYYMAFGGLLIMCIPLIGFLYSIGTIWLGFKGLKNVKGNPAVKGTAHAWIAIIGGVVELIVGIISIIWVIGMIVSEGF